MQKTLRRYLPMKLGHLNGYTVRSPRLFDRTDVCEEIPNFEINAHKSHTQKGDTVCVIGGGHGISAIAAAEQVGENGTVVVYEAASDRVRALKESMNINSVEYRVEIKEGIVAGRTENIWEFDNSEVISPSNLLQVDVLEIDCEGAEMEILQGLCYRPRVLTVEAHPVFGFQLVMLNRGLRPRGIELYNNQVMIIPITSLVSKIHRRK